MVVPQSAGPEKQEVEGEVESWTFSKLQLPGFFDCLIWYDTALSASCKCGPNPILETRTNPPHTHTHKHAYLRYMEILVSNVSLLRKGLKSNPMVNMEVLLFSGCVCIRIRLIC